MKHYHNCAVKHDPPNTYGDCIRACFATLLDVPNIAFVPHFQHDGPDHDTYVERIERYLREVHHLAPFNTFFHGDADIGDVLQAMGAQNPGVRYMLIGETREGVNHAVVCSGDSVVHNPGWTKPALMRGGRGDAGAFWQVTTFVPYSLTDR